MKTILIMIAMMITNMGTNMNTNDDRSAVTPDGTVWSAAVLAVAPKG